MEINLKIQRTIIISLVDGTSTQKENDIQSYANKTCHLVAIDGATILVPYHMVKSLQLIYLIVPREIWLKFWISNFQANFGDWWLRYCLWNCPHMMTSLMISQHWFRLWLGATRQHAIIWPNVDQDLCCHMASLGRSVKDWAPVDFILGLRTSNELQRYGLTIGHQGSSPSNGHQGDMLFSLPYH